MVFLLYMKYNKNRHTRKNKNKFDNNICDDKMSFKDCELAILRTAVDDAEKISSTKMANSEQVKEMIRILELFLIRKKSVCYGGTAINNILPKDAPEGQMKSFSSKC